MDMVGMVKNKFVVLLFVFLLIGTMANVSAIRYYSQKSFVNDSIIRSDTSVYWTGDDHLVDYHLSEGNPFESYVRYDIYTATWNRDNPDYAVDNCNFTVILDRHFDNATKVVFNKVYTGTTPDDIDGKYFVNLQSFDGYRVEVVCDFSGKRPEFLEMPVSVSIVAPTWECKACQQYEWSVVNIEVEKAQTIGDNTEDVIEYIKELIILNYQFFVALFWIFLISIGMFGASLIFVGIYWLYLYLRKVTKIR